MKLTNFFAANFLSSLFALCVFAPAIAADLPGPQPDNLHSEFGSLPAVSSVNGQLELGGGDLFKKGAGWAGGSLSFPLGHSFGLQVDTFAGARDGDGFGAGAAHLFYRDPAKGLIGLYGSSAYSSGLKTSIFDPNTNVFTRTYGLGVSRGAVEGEAYLGHISLEGLAGVEGGNVKTRFFDMADIAFYPTDDLRLSLGHRYTLGTNAAAFGAEYQLPLKISYGVSVFAEARAGEHNYQAIWGGIRVYFGGQKSLIRRHREDDPRSRLSEDLFVLGSGAKKSNLPLNVVCHEGQVLEAGRCVSILFF